MVHSAPLSLHLALNELDTLFDQFFCDCFVGKTMDSDGSSNEDYAPTKLDELIQMEIVDS